LKHDSFTLIFNRILIKCTRPCGNRFNAECFRNKSYRFSYFSETVAEADMDLTGHGAEQCAEEDADASRKVVQKLKLRMVKSQVNITSWSFCSRACFGLKTKPCSWQLSGTSYQPM